MSDLFCFNREFLKEPAAKRWLFPLGHSDHAADGDARDEGPEYNRQGVIACILLRAHQSILCLRRSRLVDFLGGVTGAVGRILCSIERVLCVLLGAIQSQIHLLGDGVIGVLCGRGGILGCVWDLIDGLLELCVVVHGLCLVDRRHIAFRCATLLKPPTNCHGVNTLWNLPHGWIITDAA